MICGIFLFPNASLDKLKKQKKAIVQGLNRDLFPNKQKGI